MDVLDLVNDHNHVGPGYDMVARPYVCKFITCNKAFARKSDLARHFRIHTNDRPFTCLYRDCGKSFIQRSALTVHTRVHTGERPHHCEKCNKAFADSSSLARHRRIHTGKRPYGCKVTGCGRSFARRNTYLKHHKSQHPNLPPISTATAKSSNQPSWNQRQTGSFLASGQVGTNTQSAFYLTTPTSAGIPHGLAAPYPSEGAASSFAGGYYPNLIVQEGIHGNPGRPQWFHPQQPNQHQVQSIEQVANSTSPLQTVHTPISAVDPSTPNGTGDSSEAPQSVDSSINESRRRQYQSHSQGHSASHAVPSQVGDGYRYESANYPIQSSFAGYQEQYSTSRVSNGSLVYYRDQFGQTRQASGPHPSHFSAPFGGVGGGFSANQLSFPPNTQIVYPQSYHPNTPVKSDEVLSSTPRPHGNGREHSPDNLVALGELDSNPSFVFHPASGGAPSSATAGHNIPLMVNTSLSIPSMSQGRIHSAPPGLQRFNSMPAIPTLPAWGEMDGIQGPEGYGDVHSADEKVEDEDDGEEEIENWGELEETMLSRDGSQRVEEDICASQELAMKEESQTQWGPQITYPAPPAHHIQHVSQQQPRRVFSSSASTSSTSSTLVAPCNQYGQPANTLAPIGIYPQHPHHQHHLHLTPIQTHGFYPTPITPVNQGWMPMMSMKSHALGSPVNIIRSYGAVPITPDGYRRTSDGSSAEQDITLTTPPYRDISGVGAVGLGISNVHVTEDMDERKVIIKEEDSNLSEMEDEGAKDDDSDEEFIPRKSRAKRGGKRGRGRGGVGGRGRKRTFA